MNDFVKQLNEEQNSDMELLANIDPSSEKYAVVVKNSQTVQDMRIKEERFERESALERERFEEEKKNNFIQNSIKVAGMIVGTIVYFGATIIIRDYEIEDSWTSKAMTNIKLPKFW